MLPFTALTIRALESVARSLIEILVSAICDVSETLNVIVLPQLVAGAAWLKIHGNGS